MGGFGSFTRLKGYFTCKSFYVELWNTTVFSIPHKGIWNLIFPPKCQFFLWNTYLDKILTLNHLQSRGWNLAKMYIPCIEEEKSVSHLFIHCSMAKLVWDIFLSHLQFSWIFLKLFNELILGWCIWRALLGVICWGLWKEINNMIFEDK